MNHFPKRSLGGVFAKTDTGVNSRASRGTVADSQASLELPKVRLSNRGSSVCSVYYSLLPFLRDQHFIVGVQDLYTALYKKVYGRCFTV